ncbi:MAG: family 20 glycosylhydrolase [Muribaculaceae bacterium]|nr:family 20 glycosylhydrolase [Muribaculaceae bacterium]
MNKSTILSVLAATALLISSCSHKEDVTANYRVIPLPQTIVDNSDSDDFVLSESTVITYPKGDEAMKRNAQFLSEYLAELTGQNLRITDVPTDNNAIVLQSNLDNDNPEAYNLIVTPELITINGSTPAGTFYGIQTLRKSVPQSGNLNVSFPAVTINDQPRFAYRGTMLEVCRHFYPVDSVKKFIDMLAMHNINRFHLGLSQDQGWRIEIKSRPELTAVGSMRKGTSIGHDIETSDSIPYGGFFTQDEARDIVNYAAERYITVIPEINMPGHMLAALASYPELGCTGGPYEVWQRWGISDDVLCAGNDSVLTFIDDVLGEIVDIFPSEYIHVGGDECPKVRWENCPKCQAKARELGLKSDANGTIEEKLQSYIIHHASDFLASRGRKMIGWDEILEGGLAPGAIVMSWRGEEGAREAARQGHDAILSPTNYCYFDYYQTRDTDNEPLAIGGYVPLEKVYSYNPIPQGLTDDQQKHILGAQANLWTEYIPTYSQLEYMAVPRLAALAEVQWTEPDKKDYNDFTKRMLQLTKQYDSQDYNYAKHIFNVNGTLTPDSEKAVIVAELNTVDDAPVYYTLDGSEPTTQSVRYTSPIEISTSSVLKAVAVRPEGNSRVFTDSVTFNKATARPITLAEQPHSRYNGDGAITLVDGKYGTTTFAAGGWLGFVGKNLDATIDLTDLTEISSVTVRTLVDVVDWILDAKSITIMVSDDGATFTQVAREEYPINDRNSPLEVVAHTLNFTPVKTRYVRVEVESQPKMLSWDKRANNAPAFLFVDEIIID